MNKHITVAEIGPGDGFQSIRCMIIPTETKLEIIEAISGLRGKEAPVYQLCQPQDPPHSAQKAECGRCFLRDLWTGDLKKHWILVASRLLPIIIRIRSAGRRSERPAYHLRGGIMRCFSRKKADDCEV